MGSRGLGANADQAPGSRALSGSEAKEVQEVGKVSSLVRATVKKVTPRYQPKKIGSKQKTIGSRPMETVTVIIAVIVDTERRRPRGV